MNVGYCLLLCVLAATAPVLAQENVPRSRHVSDFIAKWQSIQSVRFEENRREKSFFSDDTAAQAFKTVAFFDETGKIDSWETAMEMEGYSGRTVFSNGTVYSLETDSTYTFRTEAHPPTGFGDLFSESGILAGFRKSLTETPGRITRLSDTTINGVDCHYYKNNSFDSVINGERNYTDTYLAFGKRDLQPMYSTYRGYGTLVKDGMTIGAFSLYGASHYRDFEVDIGANYLSYYSVPAGFRTAEKLSLLEVGESAPVWEGATTDGLSLKSADLKGHYTFLFLTDINCPGNQLSVKSVNRLRARYPGNELRVLGIYGDSRERLERYLAANPVTFPVVYGGQAIKNAFHAPGAPYFYLIDPHGKVLFSRYGYKDDLEEVVSGKLEDVLD